MLYQYYFKRLRLFRIPYRILLAYHSPAGNSVNKWTNYQMLPHIVAVRKEIHILSLTFTVIQIRRALNILFQRINTRGTLLINAQSTNGIKINNNSVFIFVSDWLPGLLTNYRQLILSIRRHKHYEHVVSFYLKRPQQHAVSNTAINLRPFGQRLTKALKRRVPALPSISLSLFDNKIWLNETACIGIPSVQLCDTQSLYQKISYPIVANQQSVSFSYLLVSLFAETCNYSLIFEHLYFLSIFKKFNVKNYFRKKIRRKSLIKNILRTNRDNYVDFQGFKRLYEKYSLGSSVRKKSLSFKNGSLRRYSKKLRIKSRIYKGFYPVSKQNKRKTRKKKLPLIVNKKTYIINSRFFSYNIKDKISYLSKFKEIPLTNRLFYLDYLRKTLFVFLKRLYKKLRKFERIQKSRFYWKKKKLFKKYRLTWKKLRNYRTTVKSLYFDIFGLTLMLKYKRLQKVPYLNRVKIKMKDLPNKPILGLLYNKKIIKLLTKTFKQFRLRKRRKLKIRRLKLKKYLRKNGYRNRKRRRKSPRKSPRKSLHKSLHKNPHKRSHKSPYKSPHKSLHKSPHKSPHKSIQRLKYKKLFTLKI